jgi:hypothetical protein
VPIACQSADQHFSSEIESTVISIDKMVGGTGFELDHQFTKQNKFSDLIDPSRNRYFEVVLD